MPAESSTPQKASSDYQASNQRYWTQRAKSYSMQHLGELGGTQHKAWAAELDRMLQQHFDKKPRNHVQVLDIGCGPGFFSIVLAELGYNVTAIDYTESMLEQAKENAAKASCKVNFQRMDAENLEFTDGSFDAIVSRNLTWNLPHPCVAYNEWARVLKTGGILLNYDANWYGYLYHDNLREGYDADRANTAKAGCEDRYLHTDINAMEELAEQVPLSAKYRPAWDEQLLSSLGMKVSVDLRVSDRVWSDEELVNQASTPLFGICALKH